MRTTVLALVSAVMVSGLGCADVAGTDDTAQAGDGRTNRVAQPIINGKVSPAADDAAVLMTIMKDGKLFGGCTGTLVAPNLVLTALHCVAETEAATACDPNGEPLSGGEVGALFPAKDLYIYTGARADTTGESTPKAKGKKLFVESGKSLCGNDIALLLLDEPIVGGKLAPIRLTAKTKVGESLLSVGYGLTETGAPERRMRRTGVKVEGVGPTAQPWSIGPGEIGVGESTCSGDSGGPLFSEKTNAVIAVVSRGSNGTNPTPEEPWAHCVGETTQKVFSSTAAHAKLIEKAFAAAGATPWNEGEDPPWIAETGKACEADSECITGMCATDESKQSYCTMECSSLECPDGFACDDSGEVPACFAVPTTRTLSATPPGADATTNASSSCAMTPASRTTNGIAAIAIAILAAAFTRSARSRLSRSSESRQD